MSVVIGGLYQHYKGNNYKVIGVAKHSETLEKMVVYKALYGEKELWIRPYNMFCENVCKNGIETPRFKYLGTELESTCKISIEFPDSLQQMFFQNRIDVEKEISQEVNICGIEHQQIESNNHKKDAALVIIAAGVSVSIILLSVAKIIRVVSERPRKVKIIETNEEGTTIREETILLEPKRSSQKIDIDFEVGTQAIRLKFLDENE